MFVALAAYSIVMPVYSNILSSGMCTDKDVQEEIHDEGAVRAVSEEPFRRTKTAIPGRHLASDSQ